MHHGADETEDVSSRIAGLMVNGDNSVINLVPGGAASATAGAEATPKVRSRLPAGTRRFSVVAEYRLDSIVVGLHHWE